MIFFNMISVIQSDKNKYKTQKSDFCYPQQKYQTNFLMKSPIVQNSFTSTNDELKYKFIMIGDSSVGKSNLLMKFTIGSFNDLSQSVTLIDFKIKNLYLDESKQSVKLYIWDTAGQEKYKSIVSTYFKGCQGVLLIFDLSEPKTFENAKNEWYTILKKKTEQAIIILVGNKCDLVKKVDEEQILKFVRQNKLIYIQTSVKENINVAQAFLKLAKMVYSRQQYSEIPKSFYLKQKKQKRRHKNCCKSN